MEALAINCTKSQPGEQSNVVVGLRIDDLRPRLWCHERDTKHFQERKGSERTYDDGSEWWECIKKWCGARMMERKGQLKKSNSHSKYVFNSEDWKKNRLKSSDRGTWSISTLDAIWKKCKRALNLEIEPQEVGEKHAMWKKNLQDMTVQAKKIDKNKDKKIF